ncbi:uncharacterized protein SOCE26_096660 [Sorangium cellulosum]|uniref:Uncharacterized protein n=1 Tax=Sorangium cellulosum TaxID=56 RepID=A0A2L0F976_SORCE|nr:uncharacterized protein SOCE26_096660 [Sorangium cellulosum]
MDGVDVLRCASLADTYISIECCRSEAFSRDPPPERGREERPAVNTGERRDAEGVLPRGLHHDGTGKECSLFLESTLCDVECQLNELRQLAGNFATIVFHGYRALILMVTFGLDAASHETQQMND